MAGDGKTAWGVHRAACHPCLSGREAAKEGSHCGCQGKAMEWSEERKSLTLPMKMKDLINPSRSMSLYQVSLHLTSTGMLTVPDGIGPQVCGASVHQGCFNKRMGPILPLGRLEAIYSYNSVFAEEQSLFPVDQHLSHLGCKYYYCP